MVERSLAVTVGPCRKLGRREVRRLYFLFLSLVLTGSCAPKPADLYQSAKADYRAGRFPDATKKAEQGYSSLAGQPQSEWRWKFALQLAELQLLILNNDRAEALLAEVPLAKFPSLTPRCEMLRGYLDYRRNQYEEAQTLLKRAITDAQSFHDYETQTDAWLTLGRFQMSHDELSAADSSFQQAQALAQINHLPYQQSAALSNRGAIQIERERYADAIPFLESARDLAGRSGARPIGAMALNNIAICYEGFGELDQALTFQKNSIAELEKFGLDAPLSQAYSALGSMYLKKGQTSESIACFRHALQVAKDAQLQYAIAAGNLASVLQRLGSLDEAERFNQIAFNQNKPDNLTSLILTQAAIAEGRGQHDQALIVYQRAIQLAAGAPSVLWQAYAGLAAVYSSQNNFSDADKNYAKALAVIASNRADQLQSDYKITFLSNLMHFYQDYVALLIQHGDSNRALEVADSSRAGVLAESLLGQGEKSGSGLISQIQKAAQTTHSVFLFYWLAPKNSYLWAITGTQTKAIPLADQQQINQDVDSYRDLIEVQKADPLARPNRAGAQLYQELISPVAGLIPKGSRVFIVPDGPLHNLNFETLLAPSPSPHYWLEDVSISIAPSLSMLQSGSARPAARRSLLIIGDPVYQGTNYPLLPEAATEIANVQRQFPAANSISRTHADAIVDAYAASHPENFSTIHFAAHVDANSQTPLSSAIILSPRPNGFRLYARDVAQIKLNADLVTISACRGAGARTLTGEGLVGFAWAFFQARAKNVVTSLWDVYDPSTAQLMNDFYIGVKDGHSYANSLRDSKLAMLNSKYKSPYYWAPFQLYSRTITP